MYYPLKCLQKTSIVKMSFIYYLVTAFCTPAKMEPVTQLHAPLTTPPHIAPVIVPGLGATLFH